MGRNRTPAWIKYRIGKSRFRTLAGVAREMAVNPKTVQASIHRPQPSGNLALAEALDTPVHVLWPEWYAADGSRRFPAKETTADPAMSQRPKVEAA